MTQQQFCCENPGCYQVNFDYTYCPYCGGECDCCPRNDSKQPSQPKLPQCKCDVCGGDNLVMRHVDGVNRCLNCTMQYYYSKYDFPNNPTIDKAKDKIWRQKYNINIEEPPI